MQYEMMLRYLECNEEDRAMNETKHTPGPWEVADEYMEVVGRYVVGPNNELIADGWSDTPMNYGLPEENHVRGNMRIVAAAPELLKACRAGLESLVSLWRSEFETRREQQPENRDPAVAQLKAAIAKAEGRK